MHAMHSRMSKFARSAEDVCEFLTGQLRAVRGEFRLVLDDHLSPLVELQGNAAVVVVLVAGEQGREMRGDEFEAGVFEGCLSIGEDCVLC